MARSMFTDGVVAIMHFNSSVGAYRSYRDEGPTVECCYCHKDFDMANAPRPSQPRMAPCPYCKRKIVFRAEVISRATSEYLDVRTSPAEGRQHIDGAVLITILPEFHPEFLDFMEHFSKGKAFTFSPTDTLEYIKKDFATRAVNAASRILDARARGIVGIPDRDDACAQTAASGFEMFGRLIPPRPVGYPIRVEDQLMGLIQPAAQDAVEHLLADRRQFYENPDLAARNVANRCIDRVLSQWSKTIEDIVIPVLGMTKDSIYKRPDSVGNVEASSRTGLFKRLFGAGQKTSSPASEQQLRQHDQFKQDTAPAKPPLGGRTAKATSSKTRNGFLWEGQFRVDTEAGRDAFVWDNWNGLSSLAYDCYKKYGRGVLIIPGTKDGPVKNLPFLGFKGVQEDVRKGIAPPALEKHVRDYDPVTTILVIFDLAGYGKEFEMYAEDTPGQRPRDLWQQMYRR